MPLRTHARYTRNEILAAFGVGTGPSRRRGRAFTLDKSVGGFSPTTRYRDYAISRNLIH